MDERRKNCFSFINRLYAVTEKGDEEKGLERWLHPSDTIGE